MDDLKVDETTCLKFGPEKSDVSSGQETIGGETQSVPLTAKPITDAESTESMMRELLSESLTQMVRRSMAAPRVTPAVQKKEAQRKEYRIQNSMERLYKAVSDGDSEDIIRLMCDLTPLELREVVSAAEQRLRENGLSSVDVKVDDFDRIVLFDEEKNKGFAMAPSGSYQRVARFYDGSYRYGIELLLDESLKKFTDSVFHRIRLQLAV